MKFKVRYVRVSKTIQERTMEDFSSRGIDILLLLGLLAIFGFVLTRKKR